MLDVGTPVALVVDSVDSLVGVAADRIEMREAELSARDGELLSGTFQSGADAEVAKILDIKGLLEAAFAQRERPQRPAARAAPAAAKDTQGSTADAAPAAMLVTFDVAGQEFALDLEAVQEILPAPGDARGGAARGSARARRHLAARSLAAAAFAARPARLSAESGCRMDARKSW